MKKITVLVVVLLVLINKGFAQEYLNIYTQKMGEANTIAKDAVANPNKNFKSIFTDLFNGGNGYYQALIKNGILSQKEGEVKLKSTIYGLIRIFDSTRREDHFFRKLRWARNIQIGTGITLDDNNKISSVNSAVTVAIINKRVTDWKMFNMQFRADRIAKATEYVKKAIDAADAVFNKSNKTAKDIADSARIDKQLEEFNEAKILDWSKLKGLISDDEIEESKLRWEKLTGEYEKFRKKLTGAPLLTYGYEGDYGNNKWTKLNNRVEFLVGFGAKKDSVRNYDFYAGAFYNMSQDTLNKLSVLNRKVFLAKVGFNKVLIKAKSDGSSLLEIFGGGEYQNIGSGRYTNETKNAFKFDASLSFRLAPNLYLPIQVKWNTNTGRFEGYLDLKFDILTLFK